ncbi:protein serine/threonine kinase, putative [Entamoeba invadens IP1]|uniref:Protein serine/threonine kinase, putative n=1 Tax=Entamoeba invadens IP1 TaxID=370355 RepID=A0A0A1TV96_ENTIV|nr:protein serine/threonine kinase, putative [Entamoeba invadens IP1]ELP84279.1 protein serine/threonine kinase, putative [Entamoeba invadens IP1]|eukprot:XP_004183625.1 protein serine/threonine kinase, putative [Entamoeba invadens IP1]
MRIFFDFPLETQKKERMVHCWSLLIFLIFGCIAYDSWCEFEENYVTFKYGQKCSYNNSYWLGWEYLSFQSNTDIFQIQNDCCGFQRTNLSQNYMYWNDTASTNKLFRSKIVTETANGRTFLNLHFEVSLYPTNNYTFECSEMLDNTIITFSGRNASSGVKDVFTIGIHKFYFNVDESFHENVVLQFTKVVRPYVMISGDVSVQVNMVIAQEGECGFYYVARGNVNNIEPFNGKGKEARVLCDIDSFNRVSLCVNTSTIRNDCSCTFQNFEYLNNYTDCYEVSQHRIFNILPDQVDLPNEQEWYSFSTSQSTKLTIPKRNHLSFKGKVQMPEYPVAFSGTVNFDNTMVITRSDIYYDIGNFYLRAIEVKEGLDNDIVLFRGKNQYNTDEEQQRLVSIGVKEVGCGDSKRRYVRSTSDIKCKCTQLDKNTFVQFDCDDATTRRYDKMDLVLSGSYSGGSVKRYWNSISSESLEKSEIEGTDIEVVGVCDFSQISSVVLKSNLQCSKVLISQKTTIDIDEGKTFGFDQITFVGDIITSNLNGKAFIQVGKGTLKISSALKVDFSSITSVDCFEFAASENAFQSDLSGSGNNLYIYDKLIRGCVTGKTDGDVVCTLQNESYGSFAHTQCPCSTKVDKFNCLIETSQDNIVFNDVQNVDYAVLNLKKNTQLTNVNKIDFLKLNGAINVRATTNTKGTFSSVESSDVNALLQILGDADVVTKNSFKISASGKVRFISEIVHLSDIIETETSQYFIAPSAMKLQITSLSSLLAKSEQLFVLESSSDVFTIQKIPKVSNIDRIIMATLNRKIATESTGFGLQCDSHAIISLTTEDKDIAEFCSSKGLDKRTCKKEGEVYYSLNGEIDYSCPCHSTKSHCSIVVGNLDTLNVQDFTEVTITKSITLNAVQQNFVVNSVGGASSLVVTIVGDSNFVATNGVSGQKYVFPNNANNMLSTKNIKMGFSERLKTTKCDANGVSVYLSSSSYCTEGYIQNGIYVCLLCGTAKPISGSNECPTRGVVSGCEIYNSGGNCVQCSDGYYLQGYSLGFQSCGNCPSNCEKCNNSTSCYYCKYGYHLNSKGICEYVTKNECSNYLLEKCRLCEDGFFVQNEKCVSCGEGCLTCADSGNCELCDASKLMKLVDKRCVLNSNATLVSSTNDVQCTSGYYNLNSVCTKCSTVYGSTCLECNDKTCLSCSGNDVVVGTKCATLSACAIQTNSKCVKCSTGQYYNEESSTCETCDPLCTSCYGSDTCGTCESPNWYVPSSQNCQETPSASDLNITVCAKSQGGRCLTCIEGYLLTKIGECEKCSSSCLGCFGTKDYCVSCPPDHTLLRSDTTSDSTCQSNVDLAVKCSQMMKSGTGCAICKKGYFQTGVNCIECMDNCQSCVDSLKCVSCNDQYFTYDGKSCISYERLENCVTKSKSGCVECNNGYILREPYCESCESVTSYCSSCSSGKCESCKPNYVLKDSHCVFYKEIDHCKRSVDSKCVECDFWYEISDRGTYCQKHAVSWVIAIIVVLCVFVLLCVMLGIIFLAFYFLKKSMKNQRPKDVNYFYMEDTDIRFESLSGKSYVVTNKKTLKFEKEDLDIMLPVGQETLETVCVGNGGKNKLKVQFTVKEDVLCKYKLVIEPDVAILRKGEACEFKVKLTPTCTCKIDETIQLVSMDFKKDGVVNEEIKILCETQMSTRLDYDELILDKQIGEGSFGTVYKGMFRTNIVAVKMMKIPDDDDAMIEFDKEVAMLDKFRSEYVVHFFGAVFIPTKICMVTEFAKFGSLMAMIKKKKKLDKYLRIKFVLDSARGIMYLHNNGIMHRDIKTDNILVFSIDKGIPVNAKLTDFGSSRNVNMMRSNMTFTKGIGTPMYMSPEVLDQSKYSEKADVFSFAVVMYEIFVWGPPYPKSEFQFPWNIAEFVAKGNRRLQPKDMPDWLYQVISLGWDQLPLNRPKIDKIVEMIEQNFKEELD